VWCVQMHKNRIASGGTSFSVDLWDIDSTAKPKCKKLKGHRAEVRCLQFDDNVLVSGAYDCSVKVWNIEQGKCLRSLMHDGDVYTLKWNNEKIVSGSKDKTVRVWDLESGVCVKKLDGHSSCVRAVSFIGNVILSGSEDCLVKVWDTRSGNCVATLSGHSRGVTTLQVCEERIATGSFDATVKIWDPCTFKSLRTLAPKSTNVKAHRLYHHSPGTIWKLQYDQTKFKIVTAHADHNLRVWELETGTELASLGGHSGEVISLHFTEDAMVTGGEDQMLKLWSFGDREIQSGSTH